MHYYEFFVDLLNNRNGMKVINLNHTIYAAAITVSVAFTAQAQKLPTVQQAGLYAPANIKVDGKTTEWGNKFQAYNKNTSVFYTIANDADNLYLAVKASDQIIIDKILSGGIALTISSVDSKTLSPISIISPILPRPARGPIVVKIRDTGVLTNGDVAELNKALTANFKEITVSGIAAISQQSISIYNDYSIKASALVDITKAINYELTIPIKYLSSLVSGAGTFNYNIRLSGEKINTSTTVVVVNGYAAGQAPSADPYMELFSPTDFSATYTLAKK